VIVAARDEEARIEQTARRLVALADNRLYYRTEKGALPRIEPSSKEYLERGRFEQPDRGRQTAWARPVIAKG
jgi:alcohol dehydrogenase (cytochrome c)